MILASSFAPNRPAWAVAYFYRGYMSPKVKAAVDSLLAFQANPTTDLEPIFEAVQVVRQFWKANARPLVVDTEAGTILDCVTLDEEESNPGRFAAFPVADQVPAILGQSLAWILE